MLLVFSCSFKLTVIFPLELKMERKNDRKSRTNDPRLNIINQTPGIEHIEIKGARLRTQEQVLLSYMARMD